MTKRTRETPLAAALISSGFTIAGGMWGDAAWVQIDAELVASIWNERTGTVSGSAMERCQVVVYRGPFYPKWRVTDGEPPVEWSETVESQCASVECDNLLCAVELVREMGAKVTPLSWSYVEA
jgi:hypothetical protein